MANHRVTVTSTAVSLRVCRNASAYGSIRAACNVRRAAIDRIRCPINFSTIPRYGIRVACNRNPMSCCRILRPIYLCGCTNCRILISMFSARGRIYSGTWSQRYILIPCANCCTIACIICRHDPTHRKRCTNKDRGQFCRQRFPHKNSSSHTWVREEALRKGFFTPPALILLCRKVFEAARPFRAGSALSIAPAPFTCN